MAQRVNVVLVDDIDQSEATETVTFGLDGAQYEIDLSENNADKLRESVALYIAHGRRSSSGQRRSGGRGRAGGARSSSSNGSGPSAAEIRAWARENGYELSDRGRVSAEVRSAYDAAN